MKTVDVKLVSAQVAKCNAREGSVEIRIVLNDGKDKALLKAVDLKNPEGSALAIFNEIRDKLKNAHKGSGDGFLDGVVTIRFNQEEDFVIERLAKYFTTLRDKLRTNKFSKVSYWDLERSILTHKASFEDARKAGLKNKKADDEDEFFHDDDDDDVKEPDPSEALGITRMDTRAKIAPKRR